MTRKNAARNALFTSIISLLLCVSMLVGTTFAWFTDSVTSANNVIKSGNLDIVLEYWNGTKWTDVKDQSNILTNQLWEPGVTEIAYLRVANAGSLALKYQMGVNIVSETPGVNQAGQKFLLSDYIMFGLAQVEVDAETKAPVTYGTREAAVAAVNAEDAEAKAAIISTGYSKNSALYPADKIPNDIAGAASELYLALVVYMPTTVGNEANHNGTQPEINLGINVFATQVEAENDSFGSDYDKDAVATVTSPSVALPEAGEEAEDQTVSSTTDNNVTMTLTGELLDYLAEEFAQEENAPSSVAISHSDPKIDTENNIVQFEHIELVDQDGNIIDLEAMGNEEPITVKFNVGDAFEVGETVIIYHDEEPVATAEVKVDEKEVKYISYKVTHFCAVSVSYGDGSIDSFLELKTAVETAQNGDTIVFGGNIASADGILIDSKNLTFDLNGYTYTVSEGASTSNRNFKVIGNSVVTIKNGTIVAQGTKENGAYGTVRTEGSANVTLENLKLYNYRGGGLNVKAVTGTTVTINDCEIISQYGGGVEASGGNIVLNNTKIDQQGVYDNGWYSVAMEINGGGKITVNSGEYSGKAIATDANAANGNSVAFILSSGGTLDIYGGTFNGIVAENANVSGFNGLIYADRAAVVNIYGGTFNSNGAILDMRNNAGTQPNPQATISGGNFSADPRVSGLYSSNLITIASGYEVSAENGRYSVGKPKVVQVGDNKYESLEAAAAAAESGDTIKLLDDVTLDAELTLPAGVTLNGNGKQINGTIYAGGDLTFVGHTKVTSFSASYYDRVITIGEGACLEVTGGGRVSLAYGNTFNITGSIANAKTADKASVQPSLIIPAGISITGGSDATMNVTNAYVRIGSTSSKNSSANGTFTLNFTNSIAEFTDQLTFAEPTSGKTPTFNMTVKDSVLTTGTKLCSAAPNANIVIDNSVVTAGNYLRNSGEMKLQNGSVVTGATIQFGENGGNNGTITVDNSELTVTASSTGHALDGKGTGRIVLQNNAVASVTYYKAMEIVADATSTFTGTEVK